MFEAKQVALKADGLEVSDGMSQYWTSCLKFGQDVAGSQDIFPQKEYCKLKPVLETVQSLLVWDHG